MTTGYSVQMSQKSGALLLVVGHREIDGYVLVRWTEGRKADGEQILREEQARHCGKKLARYRSVCRLAAGHAGPCR
jgi:hypothetical protein